MKSFKQFYKEEVDQKTQTSKFQKWTEGLPIIEVDSRSDKAIIPKTGFIMKAYHGTQQGGFKEFDTTRSGYHYGEGSYFTPQRSKALQYAKGKGLWYTKEYPKESRLYITYVKIKKPFITGSDAGVMDVAHTAAQEGKISSDWQGQGASQIGNKLLRDQGYDGVVKQWPSGEVLELVVFRPEQVFIIQKLRKTKYENV